MMNIKNLMKQAQEMQKKMKASQDELNAIIIPGQSGSGLVSVTANGKGEIQTISINPEAVNLDEIDVLEDLIIAAIRDAQNKAEAIAAEKMSSVTGGMKLPF